MPPQVCENHGSNMLRENRTITTFEELRNSSKPLRLWLVVLGCVVHIMQECSSITMLFGDVIINFEHSKCFVLLNILSSVTRLVLSTLIQITEDTCRLTP